MSTNSIQKPKTIYLEWMDACSASGWQNFSVDSSPVPLFTVGFLIKEEKDYITLSTTTDKMGQFNGYMTVPKAWIKKRRNVKV
jgi:hypothetical protein